MTKYKTKTWKDRTGVHTQALTSDIGLPHYEHGFLYPSIHISMKYEIFKY